MKRKMLTVVLLMCVILSSCGTKVEGVGDDDIEVPDISQPDDSNTDIDNSAMNEDPLSEEEKLRRASEEIHYIRENERIDKVLENTYVTTIMINLKCNSRMPFGRITTEDDVKMAKEFLGYDFCWVVEDYPIEDYDYMVKYSDGYSAPRGYRLTGVKFNEAHDYYYVDYELRVFQGEDWERENQGYLDIVVIPKEIIPLGEMNEEPMKKIVNEYPEEQILDVYYTTIDTQFGYQVAPPICRITTEKELEDSKKYISSDGLQKIAEEFSIEEYDYLIGFPVSLYGKTDSVRLCKDSIYFHRNTDGNYPIVYSGEGGKNNNYVYFLGASIAVIPKGFLEENNIEVRSIQEYYDIFEGLK